MKGFGAVKNIPGSFELNIQPSSNEPVSAPSGSSGISCTACLLVGGESRRMGSDKSTLSIGGELLWLRQLTLLRGLEPRKIWISARSVPVWCPPEIDVVLDTPPSRGPLSGVCACLQRLETSHLVVLAIDMPRMTDGHLRKLLTLAQPARSLVPHNGQYFEPTCAIYSRSAVSFATAALTTHGASLQRFSQKLLAENVADSYAVKPAERSLYYNLNDPQDLVALRD